MLPTRLYWVLFPTENLRQAVETAKGILTKEKTDRQLARQSSSTIFMSVRDSYNKKVTFNTQDRLENKIDKLTAMTGKLAARDSKVNRPFKPQVYQSKWRGQGRNFYDSHNYDGGTIKINIDQIVGIGDFNLTDKAEVDQGMNKTIEEEILEAIQGHIRISEDRIAEENIDMIIGMIVIVEREVGVDVEKGHFQEIIAVIIEGTIEVQATIDQG